MRGETFAFTILILVGIYFLVLGMACIFARSIAKHFLLGFAGSAFKHYLEMTLRMIVGIAMVIQAPHLHYAAAFTVFGWMLIGTTAVLLVIPWQWHRRFAEKVLPKVAGSLPLVGVVSIVMGSFLMFCLIRFAFSKEGF
ncbi:MAG TPA: hypothetical protein VJV05_03985 [Pyrinomonadaceae bacterium]|nr:hypothetical protein [Pyrinomonadaceae bacterium]